MALVNTALAFAIWNYCLQTLSAIEASMINSGMLVLVGIFSWIFIGEILDLKEIIGMIIAVCGVLLVQLRGKTLIRKTVPEQCPKSNKRITHFNFFSL